MKRSYFLLVIVGMISTKGFSQTSDDNFKQPLKEVINEIKTRFGATFRYDENLVKDKWVTYAGWRFRPDLEETLNNILSSQDIVFTKEGDKKYKLQNFQYHLKTVDEGKDQLNYLATLYSDVAGWEKRKAALKAGIIDKLGLSHVAPRPRSNPIITTKRKYDGYTVENIAIETMPGVYACGSLYRPANVKGKVPLILNSVGHFAEGRYRPDCQYRCATQARMGALAFSYDLFGWDGESLLQVKPADHRRALAQSIQTLNATRILDYLLTLPEVDTNRVAMTGASGGGSQTMLLTALDVRIKLSGPVVMLSAHHSGGCPCEGGMGIHLCQGGTNNVEIAAMAAPQPQLVISDGADWTQHVPENEFPFLQRIYGFYEKPGMVKNVHLAADQHDYGINKRYAMYDFMAIHLGLNKSALDETRVTIEKPAALYVFGDKGERLPANAVKGFEAVTKAFEQVTGNN